MCRNIKKLRLPDRQPDDHELHDAALQFVRKITGFNAPSRVNQEAFDRAVDEIASVSRALFNTLRLRQTASQS